MIVTWLSVAGIAAIVAIACHRMAQRPGPSVPRTRRDTDWGDLPSDEIGT